jgi:hypothetical protein
MPTASAMIETSVTPALLESGYEHLGEGVYKAVWSTVEVEHFVYAFDSPRDQDDPNRRHTLSGDFGMRNGVAEQFSCKAIRTHGGEIFRLFNCAESTSCAMRFSFARLEPLGWPISGPGLSGIGIAKRFRAFMTEQLVPTIGHVRTIGDLLALLAADMSHCPWIESNGAIRAAQIVALAGQIGLGAAHIRTMLDSRLLLIAAGVSKASEMRANPTVYLDRLLDDFAAGSN